MITILNPTSNSAMTQPRSSDAGILRRALGKTSAGAATFSNCHARAVSMPGRRSARSKAIDQIMHRDGVSFEVAYARCQKEHPQFFNEATVPEMPATGKGGMPIFGHQMKAIFSLPRDATESECRAAWKGNGETATPMHPGKVFAALVELAQREKGLSYDAAISAVKARCLQLWAQVQALSQSKM